MPLWKCKACHHEWEGYRPKCNWCGAEGYILEEKTPLEKALEKSDLLLGKLKKIREEGK